MTAFRQSFALRLLGGFAAAALILTVMGLFAKAGSFEYPDDAIRSLIQTLESPALTAAMLSITRMGSAVGLTLLGLVVLVVFFFLRWWWAIALFLIAVAGQLILHLGFKWLFDIERPQPLLGYIIDDSSSFPSGHSMASMSFYGILALLVTRRIETKTIRSATWVLAIILIFLIGFSRVYFGVHHPSDVAAGFLAAAVWIWAVASCDENCNRR